MSHRLFSIFAVFCLSVGSVYAQDECVIEGNVVKDSLRFDKKRIEKLYLSKLDEYDRLVVVDSASLSAAKNNGAERCRTFRFKRQLAKDEPTLLYFITGFDNGNVQVFVEQGVVKVNIKDAAFPAGAHVSGTITNNLYNEYKAISERCVKEQTDSLHNAEAKGISWGDEKQSMEHWQRIGAAALIDANADRLMFLLAHNNSALTPLMFEKEIYYMFDKSYAEMLLKSVSPDLHSHPYYRSFSNLVKSLDLKVGGELPDITLPLVNGEKKLLSDYRGKYVLLDFWASWCGPCRKEIPNIVRLYDELTPEQRNKFTIISFSLDNKEKNWHDAIASLSMDKDGWAHASDLLAWGSPSVKQMGVEAVPKAILIDPEGRVVSFSLRGEELVRRIKQILSGDLYYQNTQDKATEDAKIDTIRNIGK